HRRGRSLDEHGARPRLVRAALHLETGMGDGAADSAADRGQAGALQPAPALGQALYGAWGDTRPAVPAAGGVQSAGPEVRPGWEVPEPIRRYKSVQRMTGDLPGGHAAGV